MRPGPSARPGLEVLRVTVLPSILPDLFVGLRVATGFAWTTIVAAETVNGLPGIGGMAGRRSQTGTKPAQQPSSSSSSSRCSDQIGSSLVNEQRRANVVRWN